MSHEEPSNNQPERKKFFSRENFKILLHPRVIALLAGISAAGYLCSSLATVAVREAFIDPYPQPTAPAGTPCEGEPQVSGLAGNRSYNFVQFYPKGHFGPDTFEAGPLTVEHFSEAQQFSVTDGDPSLLPEGRWIRANRAFPEGFAVSVGPFGVVRPFEVELAEVCRVGADVYYRYPDNQ